MKGKILPAFINGSPVIAGLVFFAVNAGVSYSFYHANSYKIFVVLLGVTLLFLLHDGLLYRFAPSRSSWRYYLILFLPLVATLPGLLYHRGAYNYNFQYELTTNFALILWAIYVIRSIHTERDLKAFLAVIGITVLYASVYAILERLNLNPFLPFDVNIDRVKATFGNINYFAGFLAALVPLFYCLALPAGWRKGSDWQFMSQERTFYLSVAILAAVSLYLTRTRAAIVPCALALVIVTVVWFWIHGSRRQKVRVLLSSATLAAVCSSVIAFLFLFKERFSWIQKFIEISRFGSLFTIETWFGRTISWQAAIDSILSSPYIGYGLGSSYNLYFQFRRPDTRLYTTQSSYNHVHSEILEFAQEGGILGLIILAGFWITIAYMLFQVIRSSQSNRMRRLAMGIGGGLLAYGGHGLFSVAPRMMVTRLPVFTLLGLSLVAYLMSRGTKKERHVGIGNALSISIPLAGMLIVSYALYIPWIIRQHEAVNFQEQPMSLLRLEKYEKKMHAWRSPDIYALYYLSHEQERYQRYAEYKKTVDRMGEIIPHYRYIGFQRAFHATRVGNLAQAKKLALEFQIRDRYFGPNISLLITLAIHTQDTKLFFEQLQLLFQHALVRSSILLPEDIDLVAISKGDMDAPFRITIEKGKYRVIFGEKFLDWLFQMTQRFKRRPEWTAAQRNTFINSIFASLTREPFFTMNLKKEYGGEKDQVQRTGERFFALESQHKERMRMLEQRHKEEKATAHRKNYKEMLKRQKEERRLAAESYRESIAEYEKYLEKAGDWKEFRKKRYFQFNFIEKLASQVFSPDAEVKKQNGT